MNRIVTFAAFALTGLLWLPHAAPIAAQSVCIPLPRLLTMMPMGGAAGSQIDVTITGDHLDEASQLVFTHPGLQATPKLDANGTAQPNQFVVRIAADCPAGIHEARVMSRLGISSSRCFSVGSLPEVIRSTPNTTLTAAMDLQIGTVCNAAVTAKSIDHYRFTARQGARMLINCAARGIDSKLNPVLIVADASGRDLVAERRGAALEFVPRADGQYVIKVHDLTFNGGPAYFYRLSLQELAADAPKPQFASTRAVSAFSWPPVGLPEEAAANEAEPNNRPDAAQMVSLPCDIAGSFFPAADVDCFQFAAKKGDVWWIEVASERLGRPTDPAILVQRASGEGDQRVFSDVVELTDIPSPVKPSSNGYAYDGPPYDGGSPDIIGRLEIQEDGIHVLQLSDLFGGTRNDPGNVYRLVIRKAAPDFALVAWGLHMELRNGDRNALSKPIALRGGQTMALEVVAVRRDGFDGPIELTMDNLPKGVTACGLTIPSGKNRGIMLLTAQDNAPPALSYAAFVGRAQIGGQEVTRPCRMAEMAWPVPDAWGEIPSPRLVSDVPVSVSVAELAPLTIKPREAKVFEAVAGSKLTIPLAHTRRSEFSGATLQLKTFGDPFERAPQSTIPLSADSSEVNLDLAALKIPPGDYTIALYGGAVVKYQDIAPSATPRDTVDIVVSEPIAIRVKPAGTK
ncbi:MAG: serine protease [Aureliella sp.]